MADAQSEALQGLDRRGDRRPIPIIEAPDQVKAGELFEVKVSVGQAMGQPNVTEYHSGWIGLYLQAEGEKYLREVGRFEFAAHGESLAGPNQGPVYTRQQVSAWLKLAATGTLYALSLCNIHGLLESSKTVAVC